jgi:uncharacterized protein HemX
MSDMILLTYYFIQGTVARAIRDEKGEGVISAAIAVLIMAALGALMWIGIQQLWGDASSQTSDQIAKIGS